MFHSKSGYAHLLQSRYPHIESRTFQNLRSDLDKPGDSGQTEERTIVEVPET
jgi:hypothetical protein